MTVSTEHFLDITAEVCPMTFVKTRLLIEKMTAGETAEIRLVGEEPLENVPASVAELGHKVLSLEPEENGDESNSDIVHRLKIRKY
ncbi:MAG: sulfurtransferase TusA family protein [Alphaproteobacteria bacterium]|nr:sulfurtransferase TusA family protein [Alphaproteobacteria bacterium]